MYIAANCKLLLIWHFDIHQGWLCTQIHIDVTEYLKTYSSITDLNITL